MGRHGGDRRAGSWTVCARPLARWIASGWLCGLGWVAASGGAGPAAAQDNDSCFDCHADDTLTGERDGREVSRFVDPGVFGGSVHGDFECIDCHEDLADAELPHEERLAPVDCAACHDDVADELAGGPHGSWVVPEDEPAATCASCHGYHDVLPPDGPDSPVSPTEINTLCGG